MLKLSGNATVALALFSAGACGAQRTAVPDVPPDNVPTDLYADSVMVTDSVGVWSRAVIAVQFGADATSAVRREAIASVRGVVVGGRRVDGAYYLVRVPHADGLNGVDEAIATLSTFPAVRAAIRVGVGSVVPTLRLPTPGRVFNHDPMSLYDSTMVSVSGGFSWSRAVVVVSFAVGASQGDRQAAIDLVGGHVVGGVELGPEGYYMVWVPHDATLAGAEQAIAVLSQLPAVAAASRHGLGPLR